MNSPLLLQIAVLVLFGLTSGLKSSEESGTWSELEKGRSCPPWFIPDHDNNCTCGSSLNGIIDCNPSDGQLTIAQCYCMTVDEDTNKAVVGSCLYTCITPTQWFPDPDELNANYITWAMRDGIELVSCVHNAWTVVGLLCTPIPCSVFNAPPQE